EEWRRDSAIRQREAGSHRNEIAEEAVERERKLVEEIKDTGRDESEPVGEAEHQRRVAFVVYSDSFANTIENFRPGHDRLVKIVPARESGGGMGVKGAWLVLEKEA
ncbi:MAG: hypothetical protein WA982_14980, partial [Rubrobacteraceae bacterium]